MNGDQFIISPITNRPMLNPGHLKKIKEFNKMKEIVVNCAPITLGGLIEWSLLKSFCQQVRIRIKMLILYQHSIGNTNPDKKQITYDCINEFSLLNPNAVWSAL